MKLKQEVICVRKMGIKGWLYATGIHKYHVSRNGTARKNPQFDWWRRFEIRKKREFDVEVERLI